MRRLYLLGALLLLSISYCLAGENETHGHDDHTHGGEGQTTATLDTASHSLGILFGLRADGNFENIDYEQFITGFKSVFENEPDQQRLKQANDIIEKYLKERRAVRAAASLEKSTLFLKENAKKDGVKVTESGLQYEVVKQGKGNQPKISDRVTVHYRGTLIDGKEFDSSYTRGEPASFQLGNVIKGWIEGLQLMNEGATYKFTIPPDLAYGESGGGSSIGPNEALIFEVELIKIEVGADEIAPDESKPQETNH